MRPDCGCGAWRRSPVVPQKRGYILHFAPAARTARDTDNGQGGETWHGTWTARPRRRYTCFPSKQTGSKAMQQAGARGRAAFVPSDPTHTQTTMVDAEAQPCDVRPLRASTSSTRLDSLSVTRLRGTGTY